MSRIVVTAFKWVPPFAKGLVRDLRVRWALEEAGLPYEQKLIGPEDQASAEYRALQPFGQVPVMVSEDEQGGTLELFESGAIVLGIAERPEAGDSPLPADPAPRSRAITWLFAALNSIEPQVQNLAGIDLFYAGEEWAKLRRPGAEAMVQKRLSELAAALGDKDYLEDHFSIGDLVMTTVLRILRHTDLVDREPKLAAYLARCEARPAFQRALAAQMAVFEAGE
jgi:glutathione S-transferase